MKTSDAAPLALWNSLFVISGSNIQ
ncbi:sortase B protein-sorting domain-containing protein [Paenibacillus sp. sgz302251]